MSQSSPPGPARIPGRGPRGKLPLKTLHVELLRPHLAQAKPLYVPGTAGPIPPGVSQFIGAGEEEIDGFEFEASGALTSDLSLRAAIGHLDADTAPSTNDPASVGAQLLNSPQYNASVALAYRAARRPLKGLALGATVARVDSYLARYGMAGSEITGTITNRLRLNYGPTNHIEEVRPGSTVVDAFTSDDFGRGALKHSIGLNIRNLANREWWGSTGRLNDGRDGLVCYGMRF